MRHLRRCVVILLSVLLATSLLAAPAGAGERDWSWLDSWSSWSGWGSSSSDDDDDDRRSNDDDDDDDRRSNDEDDGRRRSRSRSWSWSNWGRSDRGSADEAAPTTTVPAPTSTTQPPVTAPPTTTPATTEPPVTTTPTTEPPATTEPPVTTTPTTQPSAPVADDVDDDADETETGDESANASLGSLRNVADQIGADELWAAGITGAGVDVAVIDTGIVPLPAFSGDDKIGAVVDLSFEAGSPEATFLDTFGHGTHIAGIIGGLEPGVDPATATTDDFVGIAPGSRLVSVKVGDNTGAVDVTQVIAAIDWVIEHRNAGDLNIRVINLSYGVDNDQDASVDPLVAAVQRAWDAGIVVVVSAGNDGWTSWGLTSPATNPYAIAVGAAEARSNTEFRLPDWTSIGELFTYTDSSFDLFFTSGFTGRLPDLVAPGASIESLRVQGSRIDTQYPSAIVDDELFTGSGSSQAAAVVTGAVALLLEQRPELTPDQVKALLTSTANDIPWTVSVSAGAGVLDVAAAAAAPTPDADAVRQTGVRSTGLGSLDETRGGDFVTFLEQTVSGALTAWGTEWDPTTGVDAETLASIPVDAAWTGASWAGASWAGVSWAGASWAGVSWAGVSWAGASWAGASWAGASWAGASWAGASWAGASWAGASWANANWG
ncbi:MAG: S8 family serine peptidase [Actinomycetota bacterium]